MNPTGPSSITNAPRASTPSKSEPKSVTRRRWWAWAGTQKPSRYCAARRKSNRSTKSPATSNRSSASPKRGADRRGIAQTHYRNNQDAGIEKYETDVKVRHDHLPIGKGKYDSALPLLRCARLLKLRDDVLNTWSRSSTLPSPASIAIHRL